MSLIFLSSMCLLENKFNFIFSVIFNLMSQSFRTISATSMFFAILLKYYNTTNCSFMTNLEFLNHDIVFYNKIINLDIIICYFNCTIYH